jgi:amino acid transporter
VGFVSCLACITFLVSSNSAIDVFYWFVDLTTTALITTYTMMLIVFFGWYRACKAQGFALRYTAPGAPYTTAVALVLGCVALLFVGFDVFSPFSVRGFVTSYFALAFGIFTFCFWKIVKRTKFVKPAEADLYSGKAEVDAECRQWEEGGIDEKEKERLAKMNVVRRTWERIW